MMVSARNSRPMADGKTTESSHPRKTPPRQPSTPASMRTLDADSLVQAEKLSAAVGVTVEELSALYLLQNIKGLGPQTSKEVHERGLSASEVSQNPSLLPTEGKRGETLRAQLRDMLGKDHTLIRERAIRQILTAAKYDAKILTYGHPAYPANLYKSRYPAPILYARGAVDTLLSRNTVACVGSRKIRAPYTEWEREFVRHACTAGFTIVSGFALGADSIGHEGAWHRSGNTVCVMPGGLDRPFPPENKGLWASLLAYSGAVMVSEAPFGMSASSLTLRKRNKLIVALSRGVLICQSSLTGGAMNAYRFALELRKAAATFPGDEREDTSGNTAIGEKGANAVLDGSEAYERWLRLLSSLI